MLDGLCGDRAVDSFNGIGESDPFLRLISLMNANKVTRMRWISGRKGFSKASRQLKWVGTSAGSAFHSSVLKAETTESIPSNQLLELVGAAHLLAF